MKKQKQKTSKTKIKDAVILGLILLLALMFRLYKINTPLADFHSWRQVDTAAVARNFVNDGFNLLQPKYDDLSNVQSGVENPQGYRMVEFPLYNALFGYLYKAFPVLPLEIYGRLTSIFFSLFIISAIYILLLKEVNRFSAIVGGFIYSVFPFFVYYSRVVLPETSALALAFLSILSIYFFMQTNKKGQELFLWLLSAAAFALGILIKPTVAFFGLVHIYVFFRKYKVAALKNIYLYLFFLSVLLPFFLWRLHIQNFPEGIPKVDTLITYVNTPEGKQRIFFRPAFFRWVFFERINNLILGGYLAVFLVLGVLAKYKKYFLSSILAASVIYLFVFQGGNVQHEYYQILILPTLAIFTALGTNFIKKNYQLFITPALTVLIVISAFIFSFLASYVRVKDDYNYSEDTLRAARVLRDLTEKDDKVVTDTLGDTTLLYHAQRKGAPSVYRNLRELKASGYKYFLTYNKSVTEEVKEEENFEVVFESENFAIFRL